jgi:hypothetical protein
MSDIPLKELLKAIDDKDREFYDRLTEEQKKSFSAYLALRWSSVVRGSTMIEHYYTVSANTQVNRDFWEINRHPKLQWLLATCVSPGIGAQRHEWLGSSKSKTQDPMLTALAKIYPDEKLDDLVALSKVITEKEFIELMKDQGIEKEKNTRKKSKR